MCHRHLLTVFALLTVPCISFAATSSGDGPWKSGMQWAERQGLILYETAYSTQTRLTLGDTLAQLPAAKRYAEICSTSRVFFSDFPTRGDYFDSLCTVVKVGWMSVKADGSFGHSDPVSFAQAAVIVTRVAGIKTGTDAVWYRPAVDALAKRHAIPTSIRTFEQNVTLGEVLEMLYRVSDNDTSKASKTYATIRHQATPIVPAKSIWKTQGNRYVHVTDPAFSFAYPAYTFRQKMPATQTRSDVSCTKDGLCIALDWGFVRNPNGLDFREWFLREWGFLGVKPVTTLKDVLTPDNSYRELTVAGQPAIQVANIADGSFGVHTFISRGTTILTVDIWQEYGDKGSTTAQDVRLQKVIPQVLSTVQFP